MSQRLAEVVQESGGGAYVKGWVGGSELLGHLSPLLPLTSDDSCGKKRRGNWHSALMFVLLNDLFGGTDKEVYHRGTNYVSQSLMKNKSDVPGHSIKRI